MTGCTSHVGHVVKHCIVNGDDAKLQHSPHECSCFMEGIISPFTRGDRGSSHYILCMASLNTTIYLGEYNFEGKQVASYTTFQAYNYWVCKSTPSLSCKLRLSFIFPPSHSVCTVKLQSWFTEGSTPHDWGTSLERDDHSHSLLIIRELIMSSIGSNEVGHVRVMWLSSLIPR